MNNTYFCVTPEAATGNVVSILLAQDPDQMNWCGITHSWGEIRCDNYFASCQNPILEGKVRGSTLLSFTETENGSVSIFSNGKIQTTVRRSFTETGAYRESYTFENQLQGDVFIRRGEIGIYTPFPDEWRPADESLRLRANTHVWCGETEAWVCSLKQGESAYNLGLVVTEGAIDAYSIDRDGQTLRSNTRGNIVLHPAACELLAGESFTVTWELFVHAGREDFFAKLAEYGKLVPRAENDRYTVFSGEAASFSLADPGEPVHVTLDGEELPTSLRAGRICCSFTPAHTGECRVQITAGNRRTHICFYATPDFETLLARRIRFIVEHQQYSRPGSPLDGAYLIYDNREERMIYDKQIFDHNACRERLGMALLIARYLQTHENPIFYESLMRAVTFFCREVLDRESGEVYNSEGKDHAAVRLYNAPWMITLLTEMYRLTKDRSYMESAYRAIGFYYSQGGAKFYPNGLSMKLTVDAFWDAGMEHQAHEATALFSAHVQNMIETGLRYPPMECTYEQTIVTSPATYICEMGLITGDSRYAAQVQAHLAVLRRFDGMQPDYRTNGMPIRYWDDYWFGKSELFADTLHYWSCLSARSHEMYARLSGDVRYHSMAEETVRNCLCLFSVDGRASCAYVLPHTVDGRPGDFLDEWANDQDFALYFALCLRN